MARPAGLEPATLGLEGRCSIQMSYGRIKNQPCHHAARKKFGRGREIRTPDILLPKQARYQTALYPVTFPLPSTTSQEGDCCERPVYYSWIRDESTTNIDYFKTFLRNPITHDKTTS